VSRFVMHAYHRSSCRHPSSVAGSGRPLRRMRGADLRHQRGVGLAAPRRLPFRPMRNSRWGRHPAAGTWWRSGRRPDSRSRTGTLRWDRVRLPSKPGRGPELAASVMRPSPVIAMATLNQPSIGRSRRSGCPAYVRAERSAGATSHSALTNLDKEPLRTGQSAKLGSASASRCTVRTASLNSILAGLTFRCHGQPSRRIKNY
jgi:hypothetical protein